jgi:hypothetical protein
VAKRLDISAIFRDRDPGRETMRDRERARREFLRAHREELVIRTETVVLSPVAMRRPEIVDRARDDLLARLQVWVDRAGREVVEVTWSTDPPIDGSALSSLRLEAMTIERTDGEWPAIHQARREDEADRAAAQEAKTAVDRRLDALAIGAKYWADRDLRAVSDPHSAPQTG